MGYRDDFYTINNIIGYTGNLQNRPTVYFQTGNDFGHITQYHDHPMNIGRQGVRTDPTYQIGNILINGSPKCVEISNGAIFHESRNVFMPVAGLDLHGLAIICQSIWAFTEQKQIDANRINVGRKDGLVDDIHFLANAPMHQLAPIFGQLGTQSPALATMIRTNAQL